MKIVSLIFAFIITNSAIATTVIRCESSDHANILVLVADIAKNSLSFDLQQGRYIENGLINARISIQIQNDEQLLFISADATPKCPKPRSTKFCLDQWDPPYVRYVNLENRKGSDDIYFEYKSTTDNHRKDQDVQTKFKGICTVQ